MLSRQSKNYSHHALQVQRVLKILVVERSLQQEHVALLWDLTEKVHARATSLF